MEEHYARLKRNFRTKAVLEREFLEMFPDEKDFLERLYAQRSLILLKPYCQASRYLPQGEHLGAFTLAREYDTFSYRFIRGLERLREQLKRLRLHTMGW